MVVFITTKLILLVFVHDFFLDYASINFSDTFLLYAIYGMPFI